jgi:hypothetical protein
MMHTNLETNAALPVPRISAPARVKILYPLIMTGSSMHGEILCYAEKWMQVRVPNRIVVGATVQVRGGGRIAFGSVSASVAVGPDYDIEVDVERSA